MPSQSADPKFASNMRIFFYYKQNISSVLKYPQMTCVDQFSKIQSFSVLKTSKYPDVQLSSLKPTIYFTNDDFE